MRKYRIIKQTYHDHYGKEGIIHYYVQIKKKLLFFEYWIYVKHESCGPNGCWKDRTCFSSYEAASTFAEKCIIKGAKYDGWETEIINVK